MEKFHIPEQHNSYILFGGFVSRSTAVQIVLEELVLPYEYRHVSTKNKEHHHPDFLALNPAGFIPVLITPDNIIMHEAAAICLWLADAHPESGLSPLPDSLERIRFLSKLFYITNDIQPPSKHFFFAPRFAPTEDTVLKTKSDAKERALQRWSLLDADLEKGGPYILGTRFSIADIYLSVWAAFGLEFHDDILGRFPSVKQNFDLVRTRPLSGAFLDKLRDDVLSYKPAMKKAA